MPGGASTLLLLLPASLLVLIFAVALIDFGRVSLGGPDASLPFPTAHYYRVVFDAPNLRSSVVTSMKLGVVVVVICLCLGYVLAYYLHQLPTRRRLALMGLLFVPLQLNAIVRVFGWQLFLAQPNGFMNTVLQAVGLRTVGLNNTFWGVVIALVHVELLFMVLPLMVSMDRIDRNVERAAAVAGASHLKTFFHVTLPLSLPGAIGGSTIVFMLSAFDFVTASLMGGGRVSLLPSRVFDQIIGTVDWAQGAALSVVGLIAAVALVALLNAAASRTLYENRPTRAIADPVVR